jgi:1,4-alpha-glucan branching enzyme
LVKDATRLCTDVFATSFGRVGTCHSSTGSAVQRLIVDATTEQLGGTDRLWYKDAIIYQLHVKSFFDGNDDGIGDFPGLISKLDYIADLGVNAIWLLPFIHRPGWTMAMTSAPIETFIPTTVRSRTSADWFARRTLATSAL